MLLVAILGLLLGTGLGLWRRSVRLHRLSLEHLLKAQRAADTAWGFQRFGRNLDGSVPAENAKQAARYWEAWDRHKALGEKYGRASRYPWLPVGADPPEPE